MQKIRPCLWFETRRDEAANFYRSVRRRARQIVIADLEAAAA